MYKGFAITGLVMVLLGCADAEVKPGTQAKVNNEKGYIGGSVYNNATSGDVQGGTADNTTSADIRLALDPNAFTSIFGDKSEVKPTDKELTKLEGYAESKNSNEKEQIVATVNKCREVGEKCVLEKE